MALHTLAAAYGRQRTVAESRAGLGARLTILVLALLLLFTGGAPSPGLRTSQIAEQYAFPIVDWHLARIAERWPRIEPGFLGVRTPVDDADQLTVAAYFASSPAGRPALQPGAEAAIERAVGTVLLSEGLGTAAPWAPDGTLLFPPVSFAFVAPPKVLIVSRRDRIAVEQSELLQPTVSVPQAEGLEADVDALGYSSLVVPIGGLATYPTMVLEGTRPLDTVIAVAHEWIHGYLFFSPLGVRYWSSQDARAINETVADMVSRELGRRIARELGLDVEPVGRPQEARPSDVQFRAMMRESRTTVDRLLAEGRIDDAEAYLQTRRQDFLNAGFQIRKLNQAYFAFYGSYGDAAAGTSPIPRQLGWLRAQSGSPGEFLRRVSRLTSAEDLARAVGE